MSSAPVQNPTADRIYGFDLLRLLCIMIIVFYHCWETVFGDATIFFSPSESIYGLLNQNLARLFSIAGIAITFLSFALFGRTKNILTSTRLVLIIGGLLAITPPDDDGRFSLENVSWSIYAFLLVAVLIVSLLHKIKYSHYFIIPVSAGLLMTRTATWQVLLGPKPQVSSYILFGQFADDYVGWPLLPWLALPLLAWGLGKLANEHRPRLAQLSKIELSGWLGIILVLAILAPALPDIPISRSPFYDHVFNLPLANFWLRFICFLFLVRISMLKSVQSWLGKNPLSRFISNLAWNRNFGYCYLTQFIFIPVGNNLKPFFMEHPRAFDFFWIFVLIAVELVMRIAFFIGKKTKRDSKRDKVKSFFSL